MTSPWTLRPWGRNLRLKAEEVPSGGEVIAVRRQELAGVDLLRSREHLSQADELVRRAEKPFVNTADLPCSSISPSRFTSWEQM